MAKSMSTCPSCKKQRLKITDTRETKFNDIATVRRRKLCEDCGFIFTTYEIPDAILNSDKLFQKWDVYIEDFKRLIVFVDKND